MELRLWMLATFFFIAFLALGLVVSPRTPLRPDVEAVAVRGQVTGAALFFTALGRWYVLLALTVFIALAGAAVRAGPLTVAVVFGWQAAAQGAIALAKLGFHRTRPDEWLGTHENDFSYPSGHAATAVVYYAVLAALFVRFGGLPRPLTIACALALGICVAGIPWSRLALGAHYLTDVAGGLLFGAGWLCAGLALMHRLTAVGAKIGA